MCNLSGYIGSQANIDKVKVLHVLGRTRGTTSTGLCYNGHLTKSAESIGKDAVDFVQKYKYHLEPDAGFHTILAHNRQASSGGVNVKNAHPFKYESEDKPAMFFMHNGTIENCWELASRFGYKYADFDVDSQLIGQIIYDAKNNETIFELLREYEGGAALVWYYEHEPHRLHMWKGGTISHMDVLEEERPLHILYTDGGMYFASLADHLRAIDDMEDKVFQITTNVYCVFNAHTGKFKTYKINRDKKVKPKKTYTGTYTRASTPTTASYYMSEKNPERFVDDGRIFYFDDKYYLSLTDQYVVADGTIYVDFKTENFSETPKDGFIPCYFYKGYWIKDQETYSKLSYHSNMIKPHVHEMHDHAITRINGKYFFNNVQQRNTTIKDKPFQYYDLEVSTWGELKSTNLAYNISASLFAFQDEIEEVTIDDIDEMLMVANYNQQMSEWDYDTYQECKTLDECKEHYMKYMKIEDLENDDFFNQIIHNYEDDTVEEHVRLFNEKHGTSFINKKDCNNYYYRREGVPYLDSWPLSAHEEMMN